MKSIDNPSNRRSCFRRAPTWEELWRVFQRVDQGGQAHFTNIAIIPPFPGTASSPPPLLATWRANGWMRSRTSRASRKQGRSPIPSPNIPSLQEVERWSGSFCWSPTYSGELARVPRVHLQENHSLRRLLTNLARPHSAGDQVQALSVKSLVIHIFAKNLISGWTSTRIARRRWTK